MLVETVGVGQAEVEVASLADTTLVLLAPGMGDGIQAAKAGILEVADVFVVNKADRDGADTVVRDLRHMQSLGDAGPVAGPRRGQLGRRRSSRRSPPRGEGADEVVERIEQHGRWLADTGRLERRAAGGGPPTRSRRSRSRPCAPASATCAAATSLDRLAARVVAGELDPYAAADELVEGLTAGSGVRPLTPEALGLAPHPEGGWYRETWRVPGTVATPHGDRSPATCIAFLLEPGQSSRWHRVRSGEMWLWQAGGPLVLRLGGTGDAPRASGRGGVVELGPGDQHLVQPGEWQAAEPGRDQAVLVACVVSPGFAFEDLEPAVTRVDAPAGCRSSCGRCAGSRRSRASPSCCLLVGSAMKRTSSSTPSPCSGRCTARCSSPLVVAGRRCRWRWHRWGLLFTLLVVTALSPGAHFAVQATVDQRRAPDTPLTVATARPTGCGTRCGMAVSAGVGRVTPVTSPTAERRPVRLDDARDP